MMLSHSSFEETKMELYKEDLFENMKTLCFDIENVFILKINLLDIE